MSNITNMLKAAELSGIPASAIPPYWRLSAAMEQLGFNASLYIDGKFVANNQHAMADTGLDEAMINQSPPVALFWQRDDGQQVIQCAKANGESQLFWPNTAADLQSQLAYIAERFALPTILGNTGGLTSDGATATGQRAGSDNTTAGA